MSFRRSVAHKKSPRARVTHQVHHPLEAESQSFQYFDGGLIVDGGDRDHTVQS